MVRPQRNGLPQGSVLAPILFNLYSNDLPVTRGRKFIYADGIYLAIQGQYFSELESSDMARMAPKQSAVCSTCIIPALPVNCQFIWMACAFPPNLSWGDSGPYAVLQRTLDEHCGQAEEPKQLVDEASRFHLRAVICSGALLFSSRVLRPSLVTLCSHKSGRCAPLPWLPVQQQQQSLFAK